MRPDAGDSQLGYLLAQPSESAMFLDPCVHLLQEFHGHIDGARLALVFVGYVMAGVLMSALAATSGTTALLGDTHQTGHQDRPCCLHLFYPRVALSPNQRGMQGNLHNDLLSTGASVIMSGKYHYLSDIATKKERATNLFSRTPLLNPTDAFWPAISPSFCPRGCEELLIPQSCGSV
jgi:hypothetical protein